ncbi:terminase [Synechococcus phage B3]|nr:terminase [Synechococcus phage B3]QGT54879.1 terminase [Synechococcus phage B23]
MTKKFDSLNDTFDIEVSTQVILSEIEKEEETPTQITTKSSDINADYQYSRGTLTSLISKGQEAIDNILELARETDSPRAYEVVGQLIKTVTDSAEKLMDVQKKLKDLEKETGTTNVTNNALFVGTTSEVLNMIKQELKLKPNKTLNKIED